MDCTNHRHASAGPGRSGTAPRPTLHLLPHAHRMVSALALLVLATMSATLPAREPVARRAPPTGAELLESRHEWLRPSYRSEERRVGQEWVSTCRSRWSLYH